jgi:hypothetical protein
VLLLGVPALVILGFVVSFAWGTVADRYGRRVAVDRAAEVEALARDAGLTADQVNRAADDRDEPEVDRLAVPGTALLDLRPSDGSGDAHVLLRSGAWGGIHCIVLAIGADGDISSTVRRCA